MSYKKLSLEERRKVLETQPEVKWISIIDNNDEFSESRNHLIRMNQTKSMDNLLTDLTRSLKPHWGAVRNIYTPYGGTKVTALDQLEPRKVYAVGGSRFKPSNFGNRSKRSSWSNGNGNKSSPDPSPSMRHSSESDSFAQFRRRGQKLKHLSPDDDYNEYFKNLYEKNKRLVTRNRRPLYENKNATSRKISRKKNERLGQEFDNDFVRSKSLNELSKNDDILDGRKEEFRSPSPHSTQEYRTKNTPTPPSQNDRRSDDEDRRSSRSRGESPPIPSPKNNSPPNERASGGSIRSIQYRDEGTFVNNSARESRRGSRDDGDDVRSLHNETQTHSNTSLRELEDIKEETKYSSSQTPPDERAKSGNERSNRTSPIPHDVSTTESQYERVLSRLSKLSTNNESKDEGESAKSFAMRQMESAERESKIDFWTKYSPFEKKGPPSSRSRVFDSNYEDEDELYPAKSPNPYTKGALEVKDSSQTRINTPFELLLAKMIDERIVVK